ncbi:histidine kinase [Paenibacillus sp. J5C_2022]|uniref:sensor histidine kinase n=1 Tax=Paenibacillus sp. J5C2022 TaxID=2977129 RepID=UPI0021D36ABB|nr:histidine kinase [Paenibacillus sp. J5C2022]MCU6708887.1 histidine kinase [Paenibacillus sp. J5C2022]
MARKLWNGIRPKSIKSKLFLAFLVVILLPLFILQTHNQSRLKDTFVANTSFQNLQQLNLLKTTLLDIRGNIFSATFGWEEDYEAINALFTIGGKAQQESRRINQAATDGDEENSLIEEARALAVSRFESRMALIREDSKPNGDWIEGELFDIEGRCLYLSDSDPQAEDCEIRNNLDSTPFMHWTVQRKNGQFQIVYMNQLLTEEGQLAGYYRILFRFGDWYTSLSSSIGALQNFIVIDDGEVLAQTKPYFPIRSALLSRIMSGELPAEKPYLDQESSVLINYIHDPLLQWRIVSQFPMGLFLGDMKEQERNSWLQLLACCLFFTFITYLLLLRITRPLALLQKKMGQLVDRTFQVQLDEKGLDGEVLFLARTFNTMTGNSQTLIEQLKAQERQKEAAQFQLLLSQMNPHLLLNTLNTMKWMAMSREQPEIADICIRLGHLLEASLQMDVELVHLESELELAHSYLRLQQYRYLDKIHDETTVEREIEYALVPKFSLQPLVENAVQHGIVPLAGAGTIRIRAYRQGESLRLEVADTGIGLAESASLKVIRKRKGIGLANLRERLELLFRGEGCLTIESSASGTIVTVEIPLLIAPPYRKGSG